MTTTERSKGITASERYLAELAEHSFLDLWSYPNLFIDRRNAGKIQGKELCDLLVVCGDHVLIFSDKTIQWPSGELNVSWSRWYRRAIESSLAQVRGAERWIREYPERIFLDPHCTERLPIELPSPERRKVHGIIVALGSGKANQAFFGDGSGSLVIRPSIKGSAHVDVACPEYMPFCIGDVDPNGSFVHVFDDTTLDVVLRELDTICTSSPSIS